MKEIMLRSIFCFIFILNTVYATGDFVVLYNPDSVAFDGNEEIEQSLLTEVFAAALGYTVKQRGTWNGMSISEPFLLPEAIVTIAVEGIQSVDAPYGKRFPLEVNEGEETTWQALSGRLEERDNDNNLIRISLGDGVDALGQSALGELKTTPIDTTSLKSLKLENEEDRKFLEEMQLLQAIAKKVPSAIKADGKSDVYWLVVTGLRPVFDLHGRNSSAAREALSLLNVAINVTSKAFINAYNGKVLIAAFTNDASQVRHTRSVSLNSNNTDNKTYVTANNKNIDAASQTATNETELPNKIAIKQGEKAGQNSQLEGEEDGNTVTPSTSDINYETTVINDDIGTTAQIDQDYTITEHKTDNNIKEIGQEDDLNLSKEYSEDYPVIFNIFLWFGVVFVFSLLAICIAIAEMDPGRDSIIYRMTSNRMKKDN